MKQAPALHATVLGSGPTVVLLHGFLASSRYWDKVAKLASENHRVVSIDLLGFGNSPKPRCSKYDYDAHIRSINRTLNEHAVNEPFTLMGHSMGALLALRFANMYEQRVSKLVLANMPAMLGAKEVQQHVINNSLINRLGLSVFTHRFIWSLFRFLLRTKLLPEALLSMLHDKKSYIFQHNAASRMRSFRNVIVKARLDLDLALVNVSTVVVSGFSDKRIYIDNLMHNIQLSPKVALQNVEGDHHLPRINPGLFMELLADKSLS